MSLQRVMSVARRAALPMATRSVVAPAAVAAARLAPRCMPVLASRAFSSAAPPPSKKPESAPAAPAAAPVASTAAAAPSSFTEIVERYGGWYPFVGLAGAIVVSKELLIMNEELLLVSNFAAMFATLYFAGGDALTKAHEEQRAEIAKRHDELSDFEIEQLQALLSAHEMNIEQVAVLQRLKEEHNTLSSAAAKAKGLKVRHAARDAVMKKLSDMRSREQSERAQFRDAISVRATAFVKRQFAAAPAPTKAQLIDFAIDVAEGKATTLDAKKDPVKQLYNEYFSKQLYLKEIEAEKAQKQRA